MKKIFSILIFITSTLPMLVFCQSVSPFVVASAGNNYTTTNVQLSWTLGEIVTSTFSSGSSIITQGFQQNTYTVVAIDESHNNHFKINVFPNPTNSYITIQWDNIENTDIIINITNNQGIALIKKVVFSSENQTTIDLNNFTSSTYIITVSTGNYNLIKHFKIIKN